MMHPTSAGIQAMDPDPHCVFALDTPVPAPCWPDAACLVAAALERENGLDNVQHKLLERLVLISAEHGAACSETLRRCPLRAVGQQLAALLPPALPPVAVLRDCPLNTESDYFRACTFLIEALISRDWIEPDRLAVAVDDLLMSVRTLDPGCGGRLGRPSMGRFCPRPRLPAHRGGPRPARHRR